MPLNQLLDAFTAACVRYGQARALWEQSDRYVPLSESPMMSDAAQEVGRIRREINDLSREINAIMSRERTAKAGD